MRGGPPAVSPAPSSAPQLQKLLELISPEEHQYFLAFWEAVYQARFTGPITVGCFNGEPQQITVGQPVKFLIAQGHRPPAEDPTGGRVDNPPVVAAP